MSSPELIHPLTALVPPQSQPGALSIEEDALAPGLRGVVSKTQHTKAHTKEEEHHTTKTTSSDAMSATFVRKAFACMRSLNDEGSLTSSSVIAIVGEPSVQVSDFLLQHWKERHARK